MVDSPDRTVATLRTFVAIDVPPRVRKRISALRKGLASARWSNPEQYHITLRFLGDTPVDRLPSVKAALSRIAATSFELTLDRFGTFPQRAGRPARALWVAPRESAALAALQAGVEAAVECATGIAEKKAFRPHVTVARFRKPPSADELARWLEAAAAFESPPFAVDRFRLYSSELRPDGAAHARLADFELS